MGTDSVFYDIDLEKHALAALLKYPEIVPEIYGLLNKTEPFYFEAHQRYYEVIRSLISENVNPNAVLVSSKIKNLGINLPNGVKCFDYLNALSLLSCSKESGINFFQQLLSLSVKRDLYKNEIMATKFLKETKETKISKLISGLDEIHNSVVNYYYEDNEPRNLFSKAREVINEKVNNPGVQVGYETGHKEFDQLYGGVRPKGLYVFGARAGEGKSSFLLDLGHRICNIYNKKSKLPCLVLDTENEEDDTIIRAFANLTGVPYGDIEDGTFALNSKNKKKVYDTIERGEQEFQIDFLKVGNMPLEELVTVIKRWYHKNVKRGEPSVIIYDYLKVPEAMANENTKEYAAMGLLADALKKLAEELNSIVLSAIQLNRSGDSRGKKSGNFNSNSSAVAVSDRVLWYSTFMALFQKKTKDEITLDGVDGGSHKLTILKARFQGKKPPGHFDFVERTIDGAKQWVDNYISFEVSNFSVQETGSVQTIINLGKNKINVQTQDVQDTSVF